jgi:glycerate 2-kinase
MKKNQGDREGAMPGRTETEAYGELRSIFEEGVAAVNPRRLVAGALSVIGDRLQVRSGEASLELSLAPFRRVLVLGAGKASAAMASGLEAVLGERIASGLVVVKYGHTAPLRRVGLIEAGHPLPDENGLRGAAAIEELARDADEQTLVVSLISGGGSALLPAPLRWHTAGREESLGLEEERRVTEALLASGATIGEINGVRKHLSRLKGGRLAALIYPATTLNLILSDVVGDRLDTIASGLTVPDASSYAQALEVIRRYGVEDRMPPAALRLLRLGEAGEVAETPKEGDPVFERVHNVVLGSNLTALRAAERRAAELGYRTVMLSSRIVGEAREVARVYAGIALDVAGHGLLAGKPACLLAGGETTVSLRGEGRGGRNQELALAFLRELAEAGPAAEGIFFLSAATDGSDGPTEAAGAFASAGVLRAARERGLSIESALQANDSNGFFASAGYLLETGPTNTNVCDLQLCLVR